MLRHHIGRRTLLRGMVGITATIAMAPLTACAPQSQPTAQPAAQPTAAPKEQQAAVETPQAAAPVGTTVELRLMARAGFSGDGQREFTKRFMEENPGVTIKVEDVTYADIFKKTLALAAVGDLQDLVYGHNRWSPYCAHKALFMDLDPLVAADSEDALSVYFPSVIEDMRSLGTAGKLFFLPEYIDVAPNAAVYINLDLLDAAGFEAPTDDWTLADLEEIARKTTNKETKTYGLIGGNIIYKESGFQSWTRGWGKFMDDASWALSKDGETICLGDEWPVVKEALQWWWQMTKDGIVPGPEEQAEEEEGQDALFNNGRAALLIQDSNAATDRDASIAGKFKWTAVLKPLGPQGNRGSCIESGRYAINAKCQAPDVAYALAKTLTGYDCAIWTAKNLKRVPHAVAKAWEDPEVLKTNMLWPSVAKWLSDGVEPYPVPANLRGNELRDVVTNELTQWYIGAETWEQMLTHAPQAIQDVLDLPLP